MRMAREERIVDAALMSGMTMTPWAVANAEDSCLFY